MQLTCRHLPLCNLIENRMCNVAQSHFWVGCKRCCISLFQYHCWTQSMTLFLAGCLSSHAKNWPLFTACLTIVTAEWGPTITKRYFILGYYLMKADNFSGQEVSIWKQTTDFNGPQNSHSDLFWLITLTSHSSLTNHWCLLLSAKIGSHHRVVMDEHIWNNTYLPYCPKKPSKLPTKDPHSEIMLKSSAGKAVGFPDDATIIQAGYPARDLPRSWVGATQQQGRGWNGEWDRPAPNSE